MNIKNLTDQEILNQMKMASDAYYNTGEPIMTDIDFDKYKDEAIERGLELEVGHSAFGETDKHPTKMLSLSKVQVNSEEFKVEHYNAIKKQLMRSSDPDILSKPFFIGYKMDGLAINLIYENCKFQKALTRGSGFEGRDVTDKVSHCVPKTLPSFMSDVQEVRGEVVLPISVFENDPKYKDNSNPRNMATGILGDERLDDPRKFDLKVVGFHTIDKNGSYRTLDEFNSTPDGFQIISQLRHSVWCQFPDFGQLKTAYDILLETREGHDYQFDGLVFGLYKTDNHEHNGHDPLHQVAIKFPPKGSEAIVKDVHWHLNKSGEYFPNVQLETVKIDGRNISRVHGYNYGFITNNGISKGAKVLVNIAGDIIPRIDAVLEQATEFEPNLPEDGRIDGCHLYAMDAEERIKKIKFVAGCYGLGLKHFGGSTFTELYQIIDNPLDIFDKDKVNDVTVFEINLRNRKKFLETVNEIKSLSVKQIINTMQVDNCGGGTADQVAKYYANVVHRIDVTYDFARKQHSVVDYMIKGDGWLELCKLIDKAVNLGLEIEYPQPEKVIDGEVIKYILTGSPKEAGFKTKKVFEEQLPENYIVAKNLKEADILVTGDVNSTSSKMKQATSLGVKIKTYSELTF